MGKYLFIVILLVLNGFCSAQSFAGTQHIALANSDVALSNDVFSLFNNSAGLAKANKREIGFFYSPSPFGLKELATAYVAFNQPSSFGNFGFGFMNYGFELYRENKFQFSYSNKFSSNIYFGFSFYYATVNIQNYGNAGTFNFSLGGIYFLTKYFSLGFSLKNPLRFDSGFSLPLQYSFGTAVEIIDKTFLNFSLQKEIDFPFSLHFGIEYPLANFLSLRFGIRNQPNLYSAGLGINYSYFKFGYAVTSHQDLGLTHQVDLVINFNSSK